MAGRPKRDVETQVEDLFFACDLETQERLLRMLTKLNRLKALQKIEPAETQKTKPTEMQTSSPP